MRILSYWINLSAIHPEYVSVTSCRHLQANQNSFCLSGRYPPFTFVIGTFLFPWQPGPHEQTAGEEIHVVWHRDHFAPVLIIFLFHVCPSSPVSQNESFSFSELVTMSLDRVPVKTYHLTSKSGADLTFTMGMLDQSEFLMNLARNQGKKSVPTNLTLMDEMTMKLIHEWLKHHETDSKKEKKGPRKTDKRIPPWDLHFFERMNRSTFVMFLIAAQALELTRCVDYAIHYSGVIGKGKSIEELRNLFGNKSAEEEELIKAGLLWIYVIFDMESIYLFSPICLSWSSYFAPFQSHFYIHFSQHEFIGFFAIFSIL